MLLVNRSLLGMLFAPTKNKKLHDILACSTYVVDPSRLLLGCLVRIFSVFVKRTRGPGGKGQGGAIYFPSGYGTEIQELWMDGNQPKAD